MKIGIITSGIDTLELFEFLNRYDHEYHVVYDQTMNFGQQTYEISLERIKSRVEYLKKKGCAQIIVPPVYELALKEDVTIFPLFQNYLTSYCFQYSLVGKLGLVGEFSDLQQAQHLISDIASKYERSEAQKATQSFHRPFVYWSKEVPLRMPLLQTLGRRMILLNTLVKTDMAIFKDAMVDTVISLSYGFFAFQRTLSNFFNLKKIRFHKFEKLEEIFKKADLSGSTYSIHISYHGHPHFLQRNKRLIRMLQRGKQVEITWEKI